MADTLEIIMNGNLSFRELEKEIEKLKTKDKDWQQVEKIEELKDFIFEELVDAQKYCLENTTKPQLMAVKFKVYDSIVNRIFDNSEILKALKQALQTLNEKYAEIYKTITYKEPGLRFVACSTCQSQININYIEKQICPVCNNIIDQNTKEKLESLERKIQKVKDKFWEEKCMIRKKINFEIKWLITGWK